MIKKKHSRHIWLNKIYYKNSTFICLQNILKLNIEFTLFLLDNAGMDLSGFKWVEKNYLRCNLFFI